MHVIDNRILCLLAVFDIRVVSESLLYMYTEGSFGYSVDLFFYVRCYEIVN